MIEALIAFGVICLAALLLLAWQTRHPKKAH